MNAPWRSWFSRYSGSLRPTVVGALMAILALVLVFSRTGSRRPAAPVPSVAAASKIVVISKPATSSTTARPVYALSVIRGGAYSAEELARARRTDSVVAAHYAQFSSKPKFHKLSHDELMYVSYRRSDKVYWSKVQHRIPQGETLISDGDCLARARCGNRLSKIAQQPVEENDVPETVLNTQEAPDQPVSYKLADLPGPTAPMLHFDFPARLADASSPAASVLPGSGPVTSSASSPPAGGGFFGGGGGGGAGPLIYGARTAQGSTVAPSVTAGGTSLPSSQGAPIVIEDPVVQITPEPGTLGLGSIVILLALGRSAARRTRLLRG